jgi:hypothetical protein
VRLRVEALGQDIVARQLLAMADRTGDASGAMQGIIDGLYESERRLFDSQGASGGVPWQASAPSTVERKARLGLDPRIEHATQDLRDSLTTPGGANIAIARRDGVTFDTAIRYARWQPNPLVSPTEAERRDWVKIVQRWIVDGDASRGGILGGIF